MAKPQKKLTKRVVDALRPDPGGKDMIYFDTEIRRFGVRVKPSGVKSYVLQYRNKYGQLRRITLGHPTGEFTPEKARTAAMKARARIADGADPSAEKRANRNALTVADLCDDYLEAAEGRLKPNSIKTNRGGIVWHIKPLLGTMPVVTVTAAIVEKFARDVASGKSGPKRDPDAKRPPGGVTTGGPAAANRILAVLGAVLQRAVRDRVLPSNPVREIGRISHRAKAPPPFTFEAIERLGAAIREREAEGESAAGLRAVRFLLLTGFRRMEALTLTWAMVDRKARCARLPETKTGPAVRPLGRAALEFLLSFEPKDAKPTDYVFPGDFAAGHFINLPRVWRRLCKRAKITGASIHSLRHWYASCGAEMNISELLIAGLLGHRVRSVTGRYATAPDTALLAAADRVSLRLLEALDGEAASAKVVSIAVRP